MNSVSIIPAPVAAKISGAGSFFGSCQIASGNFEDILNVMSEFPASCDSGDFADSIPLVSAFNDFDKSEVLMQLQQILGEDAGTEAFERIVNLLEKGTLSVQADSINWDKDTFEKLTVSLLERLDIAIKQMTKISGYEQKYENEDDSDREKFLNLVTDLLKTGIITPEEYATSLQNPEESSLLELLAELKNEAGNLIEKLEYAQAENVVQPSHEFLPEELRVVNMDIYRTRLATEMQVKPEKRAEFYALLDNLLEKGLFSPPANNKNGLFELNSEESAFVKEILEKLWKNIENENKAEKENVFPKFKEIADIKNTDGEKTELKYSKAEPEIRAVWDGGDLKIETINPKTGEKQQSVFMANSSKMQERINEFEVIRQVVAQAKFITTPAGEQRLTIQLRPEHLGQMNLLVVLNNKEMQIHARVESATAQAALESHAALLREGLEKQGINLDRLEVSVEQKDRQDAYSLAERQEQREKRGNRKRHRGKEAQFAISIKNDTNSDTGRRLGYNTMEYLA